MFGAPLVFDRELILSSVYRRASVDQVEAGPDGEAVE